MQLSLGDIRTSVVVGRAVTSPAPLLPVQSATAHLGISPHHVTCFGQCNESGRIMSFSGTDMFEAHVQSAMRSSHCCSNWMRIPG